MAFLRAKGNLGVLVDGLRRTRATGGAWQQLHLTSAEIERDLSGCVERVERTVHSLGGEKPPAEGDGSGEA